MWLHGFDVSLQYISINGAVKKQISEFKWGCEKQISEIFQRIKVLSRMLLLVCKLDDEWFINKENTKKGDEWVCYWVFLRPLLTCDTHKMHCESSVLYLETKFQDSAPNLTQGKWKVCLMYFSNDNKRYEKFRKSWR